MLFPHWQIWYPEWALTLLSCTALLLFLPKILCLIHALLIARNTRSYGGAGRVLLSVAGETLLSMLLAKDVRSAGFPAPPAQQRQWPLQCVVAPLG